MKRLWEAVCWGNLKVYSLVGGCVLGKPRSREVGGRLCVGETQKRRGWREATYCLGNEKCGEVGGTGGYELTKARSREVGGIPCKGETEKRRD